MTTYRMSIIGGFAPDTSGDVFPSFLDVELSMANAKHIPCYVMDYPTGSDIGGELVFSIPKNYAGSPVLVIRGILDGSPANILAFGAQQLSRADSESADTAYEAEDTASNSTWTGYADEDHYEETITLTPAAAYVVDDEVHLKLYRDESVDTTTFNFLLTDLLFEYSDT